MRNNFSDKSIEGLLKKDETGIFIENDCGEKIFSGERIWEGYAKHWLGKNVFARELEQIDSATNMPIVLVWPQKIISCQKNESNYIEIYYNERLVKYWVSFFGHVAINIGGDIFNFSHVISENERLTPEEYFYRPALGEFLPFVGNSDDGKKNTVKFGRHFMRSVHVLRIEGNWINIDNLKNIFQKKLDRILNTPVDPDRPGYYADFSFYSNSCATVIRDGLREGGFLSVGGFCPRDLFVSCVNSFKNLTNKNNSLISLKLMPQLIVPEAPLSKITPLLNPLNYYRKYKYLNSLPVEIIE